MDILELIKTYKLPYKFLAEEMQMSINTFGKKITGHSSFTDDELESLRAAVDTYLTTVFAKLKRAA